MNLKEKFQNANLDATANLIPIDVLHDILFNEDIFNDFFEVKGEFIDMDVISMSNALNDYMDILIKTSNDTQKETFDRINKINTELGIDKNYNYLLYKLEDKHEISLEIIEIILKDEDIFNKFYNYYDNVEYFNNVPIVDYLVSLNKYVENLGNARNIILGSLLEQRFNKIKKKYVLEFKKSIVLNGMHIEASVDPEFEKSVLKNVDFSKSKFSIAYSIYVELNKKCSYDTNFLAYAQDLSIDFVNDIYQKNISDINDENNEVVCNTWAILYQSLLSKCGFKSNVCGNFHKYVEFDCDGTWMKADGTQIYKTSDNLFYDDIVRCQLNLPTAGFICLEEDKDISEVLKSSEDDIGYETTTSEDITMKAIEEYKKKFMNEEDELNFYDKIEAILNAVRSCNYKGFEIMQYFKLLYEKGLTNEELLNTGFNYAAVKIGEKDFNSAIILSYKDDDEIKHFVFTETSKYIETNSSVLNEMLNNGSIVLIGKSREVMGLEGIFGNGLDK